MAKTVTAATSSHHHHEPPSASFAVGEMMQYSTATATPIAIHPSVLRMVTPSRNVEMAHAPYQGALAHALAKLGALRQCTSATRAWRLVPKPIIPPMAVKGDRLSRARSLSAHPKRRSEYRSRPHRLVGPALAHTHAVPRWVLTPKSSAPE